MSVTALFKKSKAFSSFSVKDISSSTAFYGQVLGLDLTHPMDQVQFELQGGAKVFLYAKEDHVPATFTVLNFTVPNLKEAMSILKDGGVVFEIYKQEGFETDDEGVFHGYGPKIAWFKDPSGNILSVIEEEK